MNAKVKTLLIGPTLLFLIAGCAATAVSQLEDRKTERLNYGYSLSDVRTASDCIASKWQSRHVQDVMGLFPKYQFPSLVETRYPNFIRLAVGIVAFEIRPAKEGSEIILAIQSDPNPPVWAVSKDVLIQCSHSQKFTTLQGVNEKGYLPKR